MDDDSNYYGSDEFGDTYYEDEYYGHEENSSDLFNECLECESPVDPGRDICGHCQRTAELEASADTYAPDREADVASGYEKRIDEIAFAIVPAISRFQAIVKGTLAFDQRKDPPETPSAYDGLTFKLLHEAADRDTRAYNIGWGALPDAVPVASEDGLRLFYKAFNRTNWLDSPVEELPSTPWFYLYDKGGSPITTASEFMNLIGGYNVPDNPEEYTRPEYGSIDEELWLVPGFCLQVSRTIVKP